MSDATQPEPVGTVTLDECVRVLRALILCRATATAYVETGKDPSAPLNPATLRTSIDATWDDLWGDTGWAIESYPEGSQQHNDAYALYRALHDDAINNL